VDDPNTKKVPGVAEVSPPPLISLHACGFNNNTTINNKNHFILHTTENIIQQKNTLNLNKQKNYSK